MRSRGMRSSAAASRGDGHPELDAANHPYAAVLADLGFIRVGTSTVPVFHENPRTDPEMLRSSATLARAST